MSIGEYVLSEQDGLWEVRLGDRLLSGQPAYAQALGVFQTIARAAASVGQRATSPVGNVVAHRGAFPIMVAP